MKTFLAISVCALLAIDALRAQENERFLGWREKARASIAYDPDLSKAYLDSMKSYLNDHPDEAYMRAEREKLLGAFFYRKGLYDSSLFYYQKAGEAYQLMDSLLDQAKIKVNISMTYARTGDYEPAIRYATDALALFEKKRDQKGMGIAYNMIGQVYFFNNEFGRALRYFHLYTANTTDSSERAGGYSNLGSAYERMGRYDSAIHFVRISLAYHTALGNPYGIGGAYENLGSIYNSTGDPKQGIEEYKRAIPIYTTVGNRAGLLQVNSNLGSLYKNLGDYTNAGIYSMRALTMSRELGEKNIERQSLLDLSDVMEKTGEVKASLKYYKQFHSINDSIYNQETRKNIEQINVAYETEKKIQQIGLLTQQNELKEATIQRNVILIVGLVVLITLLGFVFYLWRHRYRLSQQAVLQEQKVRFREMQINAVIDSQEKERKRFASDLHDGMGQLVSALQLNIQSIKQNGDHDKRDKLVENSEQILSEIQTEIRNIAFNLMPPVLVKEGLVPAVEELGKRISKTDTRVHISVHGMDERLTSLQEISLYRIIQELVSNILKHAAATSITISITGFENEVVFLIEDDGQGFDIDAFKTSKVGNGWQTIQTRLNLIQASIQFDTQPGRKNNVVTITAGKKLAGSKMASSPAGQINT